MPTYLYRCYVCDCECTHTHGMTESHPPCPVCGEPYGREFHQDFSQHQRASLLAGPPTTVGQQAELNTKKLGSNRMLPEATKKNRRPLPNGASWAETPTELPWYRSGEVAGLPKMEKPLDLSKVKDVKRYIETGEKA